MPVNKHLMDSLVKQYGTKRGKSVYYAMENAGKGPFAKGKKLSGQHDAFAKKHRKKGSKGRGPGTPRANFGSFNAKHPRNPKGSPRGGEFRRK